MNTLPPLPLFNEWTPAQKLAVYDFCRLMSELLWQQHRDLLLEEMMRIDRANGFEHLADDRNLELPFDNDLDF
ncbi:MAG: hypothetical protein KDI49_15165 [Gammaproteobacteria bacterium]|nr:hypothetical protein [Gammaproteobacteria bacterium]